MCGLCVRGDLLCWDVCVPTVVIGLKQVRRKGMCICVELDVASQSLKMCAIIIFHCIATAHIDQWKHITYIHVHCHSIH